MLRVQYIDVHFLCRYITVRLIALGAVVQHILQKQFESLCRAFVPSVCFFEYLLMKMNIRATLLLPTIGTACPVIETITQDELCGRDTVTGGVSN